MMAYCKDVNSPQIDLYTFNAIWINIPAGCCTRQSISKIYMEMQFTWKQTTGIKIYMEKI